VSSKRVGSSAPPRAAGVAKLSDDPAGAHLRIGAGFFDGWTPGDWLLLPWAPMKERLDWTTDGADWPNRAASRFVAAAGLRWHVQVAGAGPVLLLLHGTGASTHSWRDLLPLLARRFTVVAPDLPGHGFTDPLPASRVSLQGMADAHGALLEALQLAPALAVGHSAGAAILLQMALDQHIAPAGIVSLNGALLPFRGWAGVLFAPMARMMTMTPLASTLFARRARDPAAVARLVASTGSSIDAVGVALYQRLLCARGHVAGALNMMANWDLAPLAARLPRLKVPLVLVVGDRDGTVNPAEAPRVQAQVAGARLVRLPVLGHLAHEEAPGELAELIRAQAEALGVRAAQSAHHHAAMHATRHAGPASCANAVPSPRR
jgi:magnesium chelatase accessory protein